MPIRYVIRPAGIRTTPTALKTALNAKRTIRYPGPSRRLLSWERDFFLAYPPPQMIEEFTNSHARLPDAQRDNEIYESGVSLRQLPGSHREGYSRIRNFFTNDKPTQRTTLHQLGFNTPSTFITTPELDGMGTGSTRFILRPRRHAGGNGFRLLTYDEAIAPGSWNPSTEYLQELYSKTHEYRVLIVRGDPLITLLKTVPEDTPVDAPWNHSHGASFVTVNDWNNNRLRYTNVYDLIAQNKESFFKYVDLGGLDIMYRSDDRSYRVCELNLCPSLSIQSNLERVVQHAHSVPR